jgi:hypothetical protein
MSGGTPIPGWACSERRSGRRDTEDVLNSKVPPTRIAAAAATIHPRKLRRVGWIAAPCPTSGPKRHRASIGDMRRDGRVTTQSATQTGSHSMDELSSLAGRTGRRHTLPALNHFFYFRKNTCAEASSGENLRACRWRGKSLAEAGGWHISAEGVAGNSASLEGPTTEEAELTTGIFSLALADTRVLSREPLPIIVKAHGVFRGREDQQPCFVNPQLTT